MKRTLWLIAVAVLAVIAVAAVLTATTSRHATAQEAAPIFVKG